MHQHLSAGVTPDRRQPRAKRRWTARGWKSRPKRQSLYSGAWRRQ
jgi:hypothetical protein